MHGGDSGGGREKRCRTPAVGRRRYLRAVGALGAAGAVGAGATGSATAQDGPGPERPHGLRVEELGVASVTLAWYHRTGDAVETVAASYEVLVGDRVVDELVAPAPDSGDDHVLVTATAGDLEPGSEYELAVRAVGPDGATTTSLATTTRDPSTIGDYEFEAHTSETALPANWADVATEDAAHRVLRVRGGIVPGGSCRVGTVHELAYDAEADALRVVVDAPRDGGPPCPPEVRELTYDLRVTLDRAPQTVIVEHRSADWRREVSLLGRSPGQLLSVDAEHRVTRREDSVLAFAAIDDRTVPRDLGEDLDGFTLEFAVEDPSVAELTGLHYEYTDLDGDDPWIADDGSRLRWEVSEVPDEPPEEWGWPLTGAVLVGNGLGTTGVTVGVDLHTDAVDRTRDKAVLDGPIHFADTYYGSPDLAGVFPVERGDRSVTVGWDQYPEEGSEYEISVDGTIRTAVPGEETESFETAIDSPEVRGVTVEDLEPDTRYRIEVTEVGPEGERNHVGEGLVRTLDGTAIRDTEFRTTPGIGGYRSEWGSISVSEDRTRVEATGGLSFGSQPQTLFLEEVTYDADGGLRLSVAPTPGGGDEAVQEIDFEAGVDLERPVERVVLEYPTRGWQRVWDATLGGDYERFDVRVTDEAVAPGQRTELSLTLDGLYAGGSAYECLLFVEDPSVAAIVDASPPARSDGGDPEYEDDEAELSVAVDPEDVDPTGRVDVGTVVLEGRDPGATSIGYLVEEVTAERDRKDYLHHKPPVELGGRVDPVLTVEDEATGPPAIDEARPTDPDDDGLYEDVDGDGDTDLADAVELFQHREDDAVRNHVSAYDFSGNDEIDLADVVQLFAEL